MKQICAVLGASVLALMLLLGCEDASLGPDFTGSIEGRVVDAETNEPIPNVNVTTSPPTEAPVTGPDGRFTVPNVDAGSYTVAADRFGYVRSTVTVAVQESDSAQVTLFLERDPEEQGLDSLAVQIVNWANRVINADSTFVDVEYRARNAGEVLITAYEAYFRVQTNGEDFLIEASGDTLSVGQSDVGRLSAFIRTQSATDVVVDGTWTQMGN